MVNLNSKLKQIIVSKVLKDEYVDALNKAKDNVFYNINSLYKKNKIPTEIFLLTEFILYNLNANPFDSFFEVYKNIEKENCIAINIVSSNLTVDEKGTLKNKDSLYSVTIEGNEVVFYDVSYDSLELRKNKSINLETIKKEILKYDK